MLDALILVFVSMGTRCKNKKGNMMNFNDFFSLLFMALVLSYLLIVAFTWLFRVIPK